MSAQAPFIEQLVTYPVKGLPGIALDEAIVTPFGLRGDRRYMLIDPTGRFMSQRATPALTQFGVGIRGKESVSISMEGVGAIELSLDDIDTAGMMPERRQVQIWDDTLEAAVGNVEADAFFSDALQSPVRLAWMPPGARRIADSMYAQNEARVSFADGFPILVLGTTSIAELNQRLDQPVLLNRFRANVLVGNSKPWEEDAWVEMSTDKVSMELVKPCARCVVIATDQESGERSTEPTATLATYRVRDGKVMVGMNAVARPEGGILRVGEQLKIT
jgi:uncharacterized protein YcbX